MGHYSVFFFPRRPITQKGLIQRDQNEQKTDTSLSEKSGKTKHVKMFLRDFYTDNLFHVELLGRLNPLENSCRAFLSYTADLRSLICIFVYE